MKKLCTFVLLILGLQPQAQTIISEKEAGSFVIAAPSQTATIVFDAAEDSLVYKAAQLLSADIGMVSGRKPEVTTSIPASKNIILIGNINRSKILRQLIQANKLKVDGLMNKWEAYYIQVIKNPFQGVDQALVIAGSDRRGTAYGVFELSQQMGVSPWHWWADVPVKKKKEIYLSANTVLSDAPKVKYRGIFINDEAPALSGWSKEKFGGFNHLFYEKVFELMLRLKANYLWPAMWGNAFYDDDPLNKQTADTYGIVIGTSHHEPLMRAHVEWRRYGSGKWNYDSNEVRLQEFWRGGMQRATNEKIVTIGMRGDGDEPMTRETATALLERIVKVQRRIIEEVTGKPASETPQLWALYKEVQDYYDKGMRVPDDVTLLLCDDNWGNIRKLPRLNEPARKGGYGIYYHFDYVGGPRNYKWLNTNNIARVWEQMHLAWAYGARQIWIVNVGDIKPMEFPISFFLDYAWNPEKWNEDNLRTYYIKWAGDQFGTSYASAIADLLRKYAQYSARRKPELLDANTYSLFSYNEMHRVVAEWKALLQEAERINQRLPASQKDAYFQLVLHPIKALANLHQLYQAVALNRWFVSHKDINANRWADSAKHYYIQDSLISLQYHQLGNGKWNHMMSQTHIGYTYWQQPPVNKMPEVTYIAKDAAKSAPALIEPRALSAAERIPKNTKENTFYEYDGYVSIEAGHWTRAINQANIKWKVVPDIGRTASGITTFPVTASSTLNTNAPRVEYDFHTYDSGAVKVHLYFSPTLNFHNNEGLQLAVSIDDDKPQVITLNKDDNHLKTWESWVANNVIIKTSEHRMTKPGKHVLKYWMISPAVVLQKVVIDFGGVKKSYLGAPETRIKQ